MRKITLFITIFILMLTGCASNDIQEVNMDVETMNGLRDEINSLKSIQSELLEEIDVLTGKVSIMESKSENDFLYLTYGIMYHNNVLIKLDSIEEYIVSLLGEPLLVEISETIQSSYRKGTVFKTSHYKDFKLTFRSDENGKNFRLDKIESESENVSTFLGVKVGDSVEELCDIYPDAKESYNLNSNIIVLYEMEILTSDFIRFELENNFISKIVSFKFVP